MNNNILSIYKSKAKQLNSEFDKLINKKIVPINHGDKEYSVNDVLAIKENLNNQEFTSSVCGQINAGKSSFLNFLLFNDKEILPTDDTPWTAKLTTVSYGDENTATITYYSSEEWQHFKEQKITNDKGVEISYYDKHLKEDINKAALDGLQEESFIEPHNKIVNGVPIEHLSEYVTKNGLKTPFVKQVDIKVDNELARGVVFVDTPGLNDKNELRSKVTEDWIKNSSSVIYLFYTGQALSMADYDFIDQHLSTIPTDKIIFALTKADTSADYEGAKYYVEKTLKEDEELKKRRFISSKKQIYTLSTLSALINYKQKNNIKLSEDEKYHFERIKEESPAFIKNNGFIDDFIHGLRDNIMEQKGKAILNKSINIIKDIYKTNMLSLTSDLNTKKDKVKDLKLSDQEINDKIEKLKGLSKKIEIFKKKFIINEKQIFVEKIKNNFKLRLKKEKEKLSTKLEKDLQDETSSSIKALRSCATHRTKDQLEYLTTRIHNLLLNDLSITEEINFLLEKFSNDFRVEIKDDIQVFDGALTCNIENPSLFLDGVSYNQLSVSELKKTCDKYHIFNKKKVRTQIFSKIKTVFNQQSNIIDKEVSANIDNVIEKNMNEVFNNVTTEIKKIQKNTNSLKDKSRKQRKQNKELEDDIYKIKEKIDFVEKKFKEFNQSI